MLLDRMLDTMVLVLKLHFRIHIDGSLLLLHTVWLFSIVISISIEAFEGEKKRVETFKNTDAFRLSGFF